MQSLKAQMSFSVSPVALKEKRRGVKSKKVYTWPYTRVPYTRGPTHVEPTHVFERSKHRRRTRASTRNLGRIGREQAGALAGDDRECLVVLGDAVQPHEGAQRRRVVRGDLLEPGRDVHIVWKY